MDEVKTRVHGARIPDDVWRVLEAYLNLHKISFQEFVDQSIAEKIGLGKNTELEIKKNRQKIEDLTALNMELEKYLNDKTARNEKLEQLRLKALKGFLDKPLEGWTASNKKVAIEDGKFKDWSEAEVWIKAHQKGES